jgi:hypothetical protein
MTKISGYITLRNPVQMDYPFEAAIRSLFSFCDEVVVCNSSEAEDGTQKILEELKAEFEVLLGKRDEVFKIVKPDFVDWTAPNHGIYDGMTKAFARENCTGDFCFQIDADEVVEATREQMENMCKRLMEDADSTPLMALPVVEYWGSKGKVRADVNPWKWRLSLNKPNITHGIPGPNRYTDPATGLMFAHQGTDGCDYIDKDTLLPITCLHFMTNEVEQLRQAAANSQDAADVYEKWFNKVVGKLPTVYHFSWWSVYEKMRKFKLFWNKSWLTLYNEQRDEGYNPFFDKPFHEVSDKEMKKEAKKLEKETGGWIFHRPWDGSKKLHVNIDKPIPPSIKEWTKKHKS